MVVIKVPTIDEMIQHLATEDDAVHYLILHGCIVIPDECPECGGNVSQHAKSTWKNWKCNDRTCNKTINVLTDTILRTHG